MHKNWIVWAIWYHCVKWIFYFFLSGKDIRLHIQLYNCLALAAARSVYCSGLFMISDYYNRLRLSGIISSNCRIWSNDTIKDRRLEVIVAEIIKTYLLILTIVLCRLRLHNALQTVTVTACLFFIQNTDICTVVEYIFDFCKSFLFTRFMFVGKICRENSNHEIKW